MKGTSLGGSSLFPDSEIINIKSLDASSAGGLGNFSAVDLEKVLAGKKASVNYGIGDKTENVTGSCSPKDLETMLHSLISPSLPHAETMTLLLLTKTAIKLPSKIRNSIRMWHLATPYRLPSICTIRELSA